MNVGLITASTAGQATDSPPVTASTTHMSVFPVTTAFLNPSVHSASASNGQVAQCGRHRRRRSPRSRPG